MPALISVALTKKPPADPVEKIFRCNPKVIIGIGQATTP